MLAPLTARPSPARQGLHDHILRHGVGLPNEEFLGHLMAGWVLGDGVLPADLGLGEDRFLALVRRHFTGLAWQPNPGAGRPLEIHIEFDDLVSFIHSFADPAVAGSDDMAIIVATACMGADHLWQDLGLPSRRELSQLIALNFPELARANDRDMKWKKFLYRELCQREGIYVCTSPTCEACCDFAVCFGSED